MLSKKCINIFFNWDPFLYDYEKYNNSEYYWKDIINNKNKIYPLMDHIFTCFEKEIEYFNKDNIYYNFQDLIKIFLQIFIIKSMNVI